VREETAESVVKRDRWEMFLLSISTSADTKEALVKEVNRCVFSVLKFPSVVCLSKQVIPHI
jgi:hypothetical protein